MPMTFKIQNWKLAVLALIFFCLFISLGCWQLSRANQKKILLKAFTARTLASPLTARDLNKKNDLRFYQATVTGMFDNEHTFLLDNKIFHGKVGYEIYTPFKIDELATPILIDRGFVPLGRDRNTLPAIRPILGKVTITGMLNQPPAYVSLGNISDTAQIKWPLRIQYANLDELSTLLKSPLFPYILNLAPTDPAAYSVEWQVVTMSPEKHMGYAVQWFALALTLLILFVVLNRSPTGRAVQKSLSVK